MDNFKQSETSESQPSGDGSKFMESLKEDKTIGKDFMESIKDDTGDGKSFMESLTEKSSSINEANETEKAEKKGGSYGELKQQEGREGKEVHHMPADYASELHRNEGPAIIMDYEDHKKTASCGSSKEAQEYRQEQRKLIEQGKFREAFQMDVDDIHDPEKGFGDKYDDAIAEAEEYLNKLEEEGRV